MFNIGLGLGHHFGTKTFLFLLSRIKSRGNVPKIGHMLKTCHQNMSLPLNRASKSVLLNISRQCTGAQIHELLLLVFYFYIFLPIGATGNVSPIY
jgi:hypothetical protein